LASFPDTIQILVQLVLNKDPTFAEVLLQEEKYMSYASEWYAYEDNYDYEEEHFNILEEATTILCSLGKKLMNFPEVVTTLLQALKDQDEGIQPRVTTILAMLIGEKLVDFPEIVAVSTQILKDQDRIHDATKILDNLGEKLADYPDTIAVFLQMLKDQDKWVQVKAIKILSKLGKKLADFPNVVAALIQWTLNENYDFPDESNFNEEEYVPAETTEILDSLCEKLVDFPDVIAALLQALKGQDENIRRNIAYNLRKLGKKLVNLPEVIAALLQALKDQDRNVQKVAAETLSKLGKKLADFPNVMAALAQALMEDRYCSSYSRSPIAKALGKLGEKLADYPEALLAMLQHADHLCIGKYGKIFQYTTPDCALIWLAKAVQYYLAETSIPTKEIWLQAINQNLWAVGIVIRPQQLTFWSENQEQSIFFTPNDQFKPLVDTFIQAFQRYTLPLPDYDACVGKKALYLDATKQLAFKTAQFPAPEPLSVGVQIHSNAISQASTTNDKTNRSQRLHQRLKTISPATRVFISYAWEKKNSQQLEFVQNRFLHNTLLIDLRIAGLSPWLDVREMIGNMDQQLQYNIAQSRFVIMIGTKLYAECSTLPRCQMLCLSFFKVGDNLRALPLTANTAYIRAENNVFYVSDKAKNQVIWLKHLTPQALQDFDRVTQRNQLILGQSKTLSKAVLRQITLLTGHSHTSVRKEVEFILDKAKWPETPRDFLLPLLLEDEFNKTFGEMNEVNSKFLLRDCSQWFSIAESRWKSYKSYILALIQTSPLGILPTLLGLSSLPTNDKIRSDYEQRAKRLKLELEGLERTHVITAATDMEARLQANLYFERQRSLLHDFLRHVAVLTRPLGQAPVVPDQPNNDHSLPLPNKTTSSNADKQSALPPSNPPVNKPAPSVPVPAPSNPSVGRYAFFPSQKAVQRFERPSQSEENQTALRREIAGIDKKIVATRFV
jgi:ABC-type tungstate transport system substrate-binding protein